MIQGYNLHWFFGFCSRLPERVDLMMFQRRGLFRDAGSVGRIAFLFLRVNEG